jgi:predicted amidohydrolase
MKTHPIVTVCNYKLEDLTNWQAYADKICGLVKTAKEHDTDIFCFAEYAGMELCAWTPGTIESQFEKIQTYLPRYLELYQRLSQQHQLYIQPGTLPVKDGEYFKNRAYFFDKNGTYSFQDKIILTPVEISLGILEPATQLQLFNTEFGIVGIAICYDSEFPLLTHAMVKAGAKLIIVPSCTETQHGYTRVSISSRARAIENQCYIANSYLIGKLTNCDFISDHMGYAGIYSPADIGFPADGIIAQSQTTTFNLISAELNFKKLDEARHHGQTTNFKDMQYNIKNPPNIKGTPCQSL